MSLGPVNSSNHAQRITEARRAEATEATGTPAAEQGTTTPDDVQQRASPETQDAIRQLLNGAESQVRQRLDLDLGWDEAKRRTRGPRGGKTTAQAPVRGLGAGSTELA